jgi:PAS domain S-box-containing protein
MDWNRYIADILHRYEEASPEIRAQLLESLAEKLAEADTLREERDRYQSYLENASDTIAEMTEDGKVLYTTRNWVRQLGYQPDDVKGFSLFAALFHPEDAPKARQYAQKAFQTKQTQTGFEYRIRNAAGEYRWHTANLSPVLDEQGNVKSIIAIAHSVHERKIAELQLAKRERLYRLLLNTMREAVIMVDNNDVIKYINPRCCELFDVSEEEILGKIGYECLIVPSDHHIIKNKNVQREQGLQDEYVVRGKKKDGSLIWLRINGAPVKGDDGTIIGSVGIMTDITQSKKTLDALTRSEAKYRNLFENSMAGVFQSTLDDKYLSVNKSFAEMFGYRSPEEMIEAVKDIKDIYSDPQDRIRLKEQLLEHGIVENYEAALKTKDGNSLWVSLSARLFTNEEGITVVEGAGIDITESKSLREQLLSSQKLEAIGKLAGGVAHEFNNLLTIILGYSEDILEELPQNSPIREPAEEIVKAGVRAAKLTRQLLAFSKKQVIQSRELDFNSLLNNLKGIFVRLLNEKIALTLKLNADLLPVKADPGQMEQVLVNLVLNAKEAMPEGGELVIHTQNERVEADSSLVKLGVPAGNYVLLSISDTGEGIDHSIQQKIFEPFFTTKADARGLGLATVWGIVQQSGGHINIESEPKRGTIVNIFLPVCDEPDSQDRLRLQSPNKNKRETILVVEDEQALCELIRKMLSNLGYNVEATTDPEVALGYFQGPKPPDLLITDVIMPNLDGKQLLNAVRKIRPEQKVLIMSGFADDIVAQHGIWDDNTPFIAKPFSAAQIAPIIRDILSKQYKPIRLLVLDAEEGLKQLIMHSCRKRGYLCDISTDVSKTISRLKHIKYNAVVTDLDPDPQTSLSSLRLLRKEAADLPVIVLANANAESVMDELRALNVLRVIEKLPNHNALLDYLEQVLRNELVK